MQFSKSIIGTPDKKETDNSKTFRGKFKKVIVYACIAFFVTAVVFVGITFRGESQAGLIEVGSSALLFVIFLNILKLIIPHSSGKIITTLSILIAIMLIFANFSFQREKNRESTFKELLVGDLLVKKLIGEEKKIPEKLLAERLKHVVPGEFAKSKTENDTIESSFEMPERVLIGSPITLPINRLSPISTPARKGKMHSFYIPKETVNYKLEIAQSEGLRIDKAGIATAGFVARLDKPNKEVTMPDIQEPFQHPLETEIDYSMLNQIINNKPELPATISEPEMKSALPEEHVEEEAGKQIEDKL